MNGKDVNIIKINKGEWVKAPRNNLNIINSIIDSLANTIDKIKQMTPAEALETFGSFSVSTIDLKLTMNAIPLVDKEDDTTLLTIYGKDNELKYAGNSARAVISVIYDLKYDTIILKSDPYTSRVLDEKYFTISFPSGICTKDILSGNTKFDNFPENELSRIINSFCDLVNKNKFYYKIDTNALVENTENNDYGPDIYLSDLSFSSENESPKKKESMCDKKLEMINHGFSSMSKDSSVNALKLLMACKPDNMTTCHLSYAEEILFLEDEGDVTDIETFEDSDFFEVIDDEKLDNLFYHIFTDLIAIDLKNKVDVAFVTVNDEEIFSIRVEVVFLGGCKQIFIQPRLHSQTIILDGINKRCTEQDIYDISNVMDFAAMHETMLEYIRDGVKHINDETSTDWQLIIKSL